MNAEPITEQNLPEVNEFQRRTRGKVVVPGWHGFVVRDDNGRIYGVFQHAQILVGSLHVDPDAQPFKTAKLMMFCRDFCAAVMPKVLVMCNKDSPLYEPGKKIGMTDVTSELAFLKLGES